MTTATQPNPPPERTTVRVVPLLVVLLVIVVGGYLLHHVTHRDDDRSHDADHRVSVDGSGKSAEQLDIQGGVDSLSITAGARGGDDVVAETPEGSRAVPRLDRTGDDRVTVTTVGTDENRGGPVNLTVRLDADVTWTVAVNGGTQRLAVDLSGGKLARLDVNQGVAAIDARLPRPGGPLVVRIGGGSSAVALHAPAGVPARVTFAAGAGSAAVDGVTRSGVGAGTTLTTNDWPGTTDDRVDVAVTSGVGTLTLDRTP